MAKLLRARERANARYEYRRRLRGEPALPAERVRRVLVVCHGNICRSPYAAAKLRATHSSLEVISSGLWAGSDNTADATALTVAARRGLDFEDHRSQATSGCSIAWADVILGMEGHHIAELSRRWPEARTKSRLLGDYLETPPYTILDPWGCSPSVFGEVFDRIDQAVTRFAMLCETASP